MKKFYSQAGQDAAAFEVCGNNGFFVDFGCNDPRFHNNTFALEEVGWTGILVDIDPHMVSLCSGSRSNKNSYICADLATKDIKELLVESGAPKNIDYMSMDADEANEFILNGFPFDEYHVKFITFEHDLYRLGSRLKDQAKEILVKHGFKLYKENVVAAGYGEFEDWWINESYSKHG